MRVRSVALVGLSLTILALAAEAFPENGAVEWAADGANIGTLHLTLSRSDKKDITALAAALGLTDPARVELDFTAPGLIPPIDLPAIGRQMLIPLRDVAVTDTSSIRIRRDAKTPGGYVVNVGRRGIQSLHVRVVNETVEVYESSSWVP